MKSQVLPSVAGGVESLALESSKLRAAVHAVLIKRAGGVAFASLAGLGFALAPAAVQAATFTVNSTADTYDANPGDGVCATAADECTLRAAIEEANANDNGPSTVDKLTFDSTVSGTILLGGTSLVITDELTIAGPGELLSNLVYAGMIKRRSSAPVVLPLHRP